MRLSPIRSTQIRHVKLSLSLNGLRGLNLNIELVNGRTDRREDKETDDIEITVGHPRKNASSE